MLNFWHSNHLNAITWTVKLNIWFFEGIVSSMLEYGVSRNPVDPKEYFCLISGESPKGSMQFVYLLFQESVPKKWFNLRANLFTNIGDCQILTHVQPQIGVLQFQFNMKVCPCKVQTQIRISRKLNWILQHI